MNNLDIFFESLPSQEGSMAMAVQLVDKGIQVNGVAPGPIWTPLIPSRFSAEEMSEFGGDTPMRRPSRPSKVAPACVFLAFEDSSLHHRTDGQMIHINGGTPVGG